MIQATFKVPENCRENPVCDFLKVKLGVGAELILIGAHGKMFVLIIIFIFPKPKKNWPTVSQMSECEYFVNRATFQEVYIAK